MELFDVYDDFFVKTGQTHERGIPLEKGSNLLVVQIWIKNTKGEYLITKRHPSLWMGNMYQTTGGCAITNESSMDAILRETSEEIGLTLKKDELEQFTHYHQVKNPLLGGAFFDIYYLKKDIPLQNITLQKEETIDARWATTKEIIELEKKGQFMPFNECYPYIHQLFALK